MKFVHHVAIRYNVPLLFTGRTDREGRQTADEAWLRHRQGLFTTYTLPSLANQTARDFRIIVFYDRASPEWLKQENVELARRYPNFMPVYVDSMQEALAALDQAIRDAHANEGATHSLVTRLDNDDALHRGAIGALQRHFTGQEFEVLNFDGIICFRRAPGEVLNYSRYRGGPFVSLIERIGEGFHTAIFDKNHGHWLRDGKVTQVGPFPYAMQILHERNLSNSPGGFPVFGVNLANYGFAYEMQESYARHLATHFRYKRAKRAAKRLRKAAGGA